MKQTAERPARKTFRDKYLAVAIVILAFFLTNGVVAQETLPQNKYSSINGAGFLYKRMGFDSVLMIPLSTSPHLPYRAGAIRYHADDSTVEVHTGTQWIKANRGSGGGIADLKSSGSGFSLVLPPDSIRSVRPFGNWIAGDTTTVREELRLIIVPQVGDGLLVDPSTDAIKRDTTRGTGIPTYHYIDSLKGTGPVSTDSAYILTIGGSDFAGATTYENTDLFGKSYDVYYNGFKFLNRYEEYDTTATGGFEILIDGFTVNPSDTFKVFVGPGFGVNVGASGSGGTQKKIISGRNVIIEEFGGRGNDWSFVRTPDNYTHNGAPHRLVILNHGNGWVMDGSPAMANFSSKTQYGVDPGNGGAYLPGGGDPLYVEYSSPLIETLLANGYVVAGCQNFGDNLYGNDSCRNAAVDFYNWVQLKYNVEPRVYIIGASNGMMTTVNETRLLGPDKVAAMVGLYPLCDLIDHYLNYAPHRVPINTAYGLTTTYAVKATMLADSLLWTHCPVNYDVIGSTDANTQKTFLLPPTLLIASGGDTVVDIDFNSVLLKAVMNRSRLECKMIDIDPGGVNGYDHGDFRHFQVSTIVEFLKTHR